MTILWCGGEDIDFEAGVYVDPGAPTYYDGQQMARCGIAGNIALSRSKSFESVTTAWLACMIRSAWTGVAGDPLIIGLVDHDSINNGIWIRHINNRLGLCKYDGSTITDLTQESGSSANDTYRKLDMFISDYGSSASVDVYIDGTTLIMSYIGDISLTDISALNSVCVGGSISWHWVAEIIVSTNDTRAMRLFTKYLNGAGDLNEFAYGSYADLDEVSLSDADQAYTPDPDKTMLVTGPSLPSGDWVVNAFKNSARCVDGTGSLGAKLVVKSGGTVSAESTAQNCSGYWQTIERLMIVNPVTGVQFTPDEIDALQLGIKSGTV